MQVKFHAEKEAQRFEIQWLESSARNFSINVVLLPVPPGYGLHISLRQFFQWADSRRTVVLCPAAPGLNPVGMIAPCQGRQALDSYVKPRELCKSDRFGARWGNFPGFSSRKSVVLTTQWPLWGRTLWLPGF